LPAKTFYIFTIENLKQFGALKAIGVTDGRITGMILLQAFVVGVIGYCLGIAMTATFFEVFKNNLDLRGFRLPPEIMAGTGVAVLLIVALASLMSIRAEALPREFSGGQQQRVALARALIHEPRLLVCDEPTSALDADTGHTVMELLRNVAVRKDRALIVVTHDSRTFDFADRIAYMNDGRIVRTEVREEPAGRLQAPSTDKSLAKEEQSNIKYGLPILAVFALVFAMVSVVNLTPARP
jgi:ABC transporter/FtsX-like permease family